MAEPSSRKSSIYACLLLALGTAALYWPVTGYPFIDLDDNAYVFHNPEVQAGLTWHGFLWAFNGIHVGNWHPLTWLSHMLDCQLFGLTAGGHHLVNLLLHIANTLLLFTLLRSATGAEWRSAVIAGLFAWHPLHVESVTWIAERKDVLSTFFWLLTMAAYLRYANLSTAQNPKYKGWYALALTFYLLALLSKPMAVTLPFVLLLLDWWPLQRISNFKIKNSKLPSLIIEKIPFFLLTIALCVVTFLVQRQAGAICPVVWSSRLGNIPVSYVRYISKCLWPVDLSIIYPYVFDWPASVIAGSGLLLVLFSIIALARLRHQPWLATSWFWFFGTLVPVIGLVQVGGQSMADRYCYIPSIGLFIGLVWGMADFFAKRRSGRIILPLLGGSALAGCALATSIQISYWQNSDSLFLHALDVTENNYMADNALGKVFENAGDKARAAVLYREALRIEPRYIISHYNLGICLSESGLQDEALQHLSAAAGHYPPYPEPQFYLGAYFFQNEQWADAERCFAEAIRMNPGFTPAHLFLAKALARQGRYSDAAAQYREALRLEPGLADATKGLAALPAANPGIK